MVTTATTTNINKSLLFFKRAVACGLIGAIVGCIFSLAYDASHDVSEYYKPQSCIDHNRWRVVSPRGKFAVADSEGKIYHVDDTEANRKAVLEQGYDVFDSRRILIRTPDGKSFTADDTKENRALAQVRGDKAFSYAQLAEACDRALFERTFEHISFCAIVGALLGAFVPLLISAWFLLLVMLGQISNAVRSDQ